MKQLTIRHGVPELTAFAMPEQDVVQHSPDPPMPIPTAFNWPNLIRQRLRLVETQSHTKRDS